MDERYVIKSGSCWRYGWEANHDREQGNYMFLFDGTMGSCVLCEITEDLFNQIEDGSDEADQIGMTGRRLFMYVCDKCDPTYSVVFDKDYQSLAPWAQLPECETGFSFGG